jgi:hypothetical protein
VVGFKRGCVSLGFINSHCWRCRVGLGHLFPPVASGICNLQMIEST